MSTADASEGFDRLYDFMAQSGAVEHRVGRGIGPDVGRERGRWSAGVDRQRGPAQAVGRRVRGGGLPLRGGEGRGVGVSQGVQLEPGDLLLRICGTANGMLVR